MSLVVPLEEIFANKTILLANHESWERVELGIITPDERILNRKFWLFGLNGYLKAIEDVTSSVTVGHLSSRDVQRIPFPLPPLAEQRRIVTKLERLLGKVDASQQRLTPSLLALAFAGQLVPQDPTNEPAEKLLERIRVNSRE